MEDARIMNSVEGLCEEMETVRGFCYLGDRVMEAVVGRQL